jgi:hypothetical protein
VSPPPFFLSPAPAEANCTYFKFFTTGENARIFQRTTKKGENFSSCDKGGVRELLTLLYLSAYPRTGSSSIICG